MSNDADKMNIPTSERISPWSIEFPHHKIGAKFFSFSINKTLFSLSSFLNGDIDGLITDLIAQDTAERLKGESGAV